MSFALNEYSEDEIKNFQIVAKLEDDKDNNVAPAKEILGHYVEAHQINRKNQIVNETKTVFLGQLEWSDEMTALVSRYLEEGNWYVNVGMVDKGNLQKILRAITSALRRSTAEKQ